MDNKEYLQKIKAKLMLEAEPNKEMQEKSILFKNVFLNSSDGKEVLGILLKELMYLDKISSMPEIALHNVAVEIMKLLGLNSSIDLIDKL